MPYLSSKRSSSSSQLLAILKPRADRFHSKRGISAIAVPQIEVNGDHILLPLGVAINKGERNCDAHKHIQSLKGFFPADCCACLASSSKLLTIVSGGHIFSSFSF